MGLYHLAWEVDTLDELARLRGALSEAGALVGASDHGATKSLYARDPDGLELEVAWLVPTDQLDPQRAPGTRHLDLEGERLRYGGATVGGPASAERR